MEKTTVPAEQTRKLRPGKKPAPPGNSLPPAYLRLVKRFRLRPIRTDE
jgi:hypothetical protein